MTEAPANTRDSGQLIMNTQLLLSMLQSGNLSRQEPQLLLQHSLQPASGLEPLKEQEIRGAHPPAPRPQSGDSVADGVCLAF